MPARSGPPATPLLLFATLAVSMAPVLIQVCTLPPALMSALRMLITAGLLFPFAYAKRAEFFALSRREKLALAGAGMLMGAHFLLFIGAFEYTSFESAVILLAFQPVLAAMIGSWFLGERTSGGMWLCVGIAFAGLVLLMWEDVQRDLAELDWKHVIGDFMVIGAGTVIVCAMTIGRKLRQKLSFGPYTVGLFASGGLAVLLWSQIGWLAAFSWLPLSQEPISGHGTEAWLWLGSLILVPTLMGHTLFNYLVKHVRLFFINIVILAEPVISMFAKWVINRPDIFGAVELGPLKIAGSVVLIGGVVASLVLREKLRAVKL